MPLDILAAIREAGLTGIIFPDQVSINGVNPPVTFFWGSELFTIVETLSVHIGEVPCLYVGNTTKKDSTTYGIKMKLAENSRRVLEARYLLRDKKGKVIEEPEDLFARVAKDIAKADFEYGKSDVEVAETEEAFYKMMENLEFIPNSPTLFNAGRPLQLLSACFVLPVEDSLEGIFSTLKDMVMVQRTGGGTGFSFSRLRPRGDLVKKTMREASGPISFMQSYDSATGVIKQGGMRRGANMGILRVDHPDIREFIHCKDQGNEILSNFNVSVAATDEFMKAVKQGKSIELVNPRSGEFHEEVDAQELFDEMCQNAWRTGDPGMWFIDRTNELEPANDLIEATNPCGEQPLLPYESCVLGSINVAKFIVEGVAIAGVHGFHWDRLRETIWKCVHFLDNVIDRNRYPIDSIRGMSQKYRRIGLGIMGWADALVLLRIPYDSPEALELAEKLMNFITDEAFNASVDLAKQRGPFLGYKDSSYETLPKVPRNILRTTIAPTGTISRIAGCSSGIEPYFALAYESHVLDGQVLIDTAPTFEIMLEILGYTPDEIARILTKVVDNGGKLQDLDIGPIGNEAKNLFKTAMEIPWEVHVKMQAAFQKYTDNAVSKTINLPEDATVEDIKGAYMMAYDEGCKGITVYRDKSKVVQVLNLPQEEQATQTRPSVLQSETEKIRTGHDNLYITITHDKGKPLEVFCNIGKAGGDIAAYAQGVGRLISVALRGGVDPELLISQLENISCGHPAYDEGVAIQSDLDAMAKALKRFLVRHGNNIKENDITELRFAECPECGGKLIHEEGCDHCTSCDYTKCY